MGTCESVGALHCQAEEKVQDPGGATNDSTLGRARSRTLLGVMGGGPQRLQPRISTFTRAPHPPRAPSSSQGPGGQPGGANSNLGSHDCCHLVDCCHIVLRQASVSVDSLWKDYSAAGCPCGLSGKLLPGLGPSAPPACLQCTEAEIERERTRGRDPGLSVGVQAQRAHSV